MSDLTTNQKGAIAETAVVHAATKCGLIVLKPVHDVRSDLVFDLRGRFIRVQCKWAVRHDDVVAVRCRSCRRSRAGLVHRTYTAAEIDAFAAYCADLDRCFYFPIKWVGDRAAIQLRLGPTRNNQRDGVNWANEFDFERLHFDSLGP